ncbi:putative phosphatase regulatory subunit-domain-containing protein [Phascolomyces articulosus]|uniref:Phosphatase regulatory subunit-domain-containing protein n=1 Tax=Phascolomyces articulosus TaxID=60185 RepID=A0AAD5K6K9_9FUNG|nr:putative phosphatase regulatory subunit-domain-containing protein [Phascolomyces articulosus]
MSLAPSFSAPCFFTYNQHQHNLYSPQPHYNHSFSTERRRRVTLLHASTKKQQPSSYNHNKNNLTTTTTTITTITTTTRPQQQQQQHEIKKSSSSSSSKKSATSQTSNNTKQKKKSVRFQKDDQLEHIRLFLKTQKPLAIQQGDPALSLALKYPNWPAKTTLSMRHLSMIRMEGVQASTTQPSTLVGRCRVANLAFEKHVMVRYTTDYWQSFHETEAMYREPIGSSANTWDRFTFLIDLESYFVRRCREPTTVYLALRYSVNEHEYWDNNDGLNYQIDIIPSTLTDDEDDDNNEEKENESDDVLDNKSTTLATIEKEEGQALYRGNHNKLSHTSINNTTKQQKSTNIQQKPFNSSLSTFTNSTTSSTTTATPTSTSTTNTTTTTTNKKKLGHRYDFGASLSEAKKTPYGVYQFGKGPMMQFSTFTKQEDNSQSRYHEFVNKYCFYGTNYSTSPTSTSPSSLPSSEPICG